MLSEDTDVKFEKHESYATQKPTSVQLDLTLNCTTPPTQTHTCHTYHTLTLVCLVLSVLFRFGSCSVFCVCVCVFICSIYPPHSVLLVLMEILLPRYSDLLHTN